MDKIIEALCNNMNALIGVAGTVMGTILGWILSRLTTGKLFIHIQKSDVACEYAENKEEPIRYYKERFVISLYNSANIPKTIRNLNVVFKDASNKAILTIKAQDASTTRIQCHMIVSDEINLVNIDSKMGTEIIAFYQTWDVPILRKAKKVELHYQTEKMRKKKITMWKYDYSKIGEEQQNGR